jgi:hypothetical protein
MAFQVIRHCVQSICEDDRAPSDSYMTVELMGNDLFDPVTKASIPCGWTWRSEFSVADATVGPNVACMETCALTCNDSLEPNGSWYRVKVYTGGRLDGSSATGGRLCETWRLTLKCATTVFAAPAYLRDYAVRIDGECATC